MDLRLCVALFSLPLTCVSPASHIPFLSSQRVLPICDSAQRGPARNITPAYLTYAEISSLIYCLLHMLTLRVPSIVYS
uniref:Putative secreted protein n=1 Tax=Anopheles marajoara TaxID=58244 RepID=A0A2M4CCB0_9DIPT